MEHINSVRLRGTLTSVPRGRTFGNGTALVRMLITVRLDELNRIDVIPVTVWDHVFDLSKLICMKQYDAVEIEGQIHRRFWTDAQGDHSRIEIVATSVMVEAECAA